MSFNRIITPRFYIDNCNWQASRGLSRNSMITIDADEIQLNTGYTKYQMFDMSPQNYVTFNTSGDSDSVLVAIDLGVAGISTNSLTILNHNLSIAGGNITIQHHTSAITAPTGVGTAVAGIAAVVNGGTVGSGISTPNNSGDTVLTFTASTDRYWAIIFNDVATWSATDLQIGEIVLSQYYTMPVSPDMPTTRSFGFEGVKVQKSLGGKAFGSAQWLGASSGDYEPFRSVTTSETAVGGRESFDFSYTYLKDSDVFPSDMSALYGSSNFLGDVVNKASLQLIPFVYTGDSTSTTKGDYYYARFEQPTLTTSMPASQAVSFSARIVQEF